MDWKDGLTAAAVVGLGYLGFRKGAESFSVEWDEDGYAEKQARFLRRLVEDAIRNGCWSYEEVREIVDEARDLGLHLVESDHYRNRAESFSADTLKTVWAKGDMRIVADYDHDFWYHADAGGWFEGNELEELVNRVNEYGVYRLTLEKWNPEVGVGWDYVDGLGGNIPSDTHSLMDIAREQFSEFGDFKEAESHEYVYHGSCEDRLKKLVKMLKGAGVWYSNPTIENYMEYEGVSEKEAKELVSLNWNDELDTTIAYLLDYAKDGGFPRTETFEAKQTFIESKYGAVSSEDVDAMVNEMHLQGDFIRWLTLHKLHPDVFNEWAYQYTQEMKQDE